MEKEVKEEIVKIKKGVEMQEGEQMEREMKVEEEMEMDGGKGTNVEKCKKKKNGMWLNTGR